jgi:predicted dehydrogenase
MHFSNDRRRFLKTSAARAAATTLPKWFLEESRDLARGQEKAAAPSERPGIALIGCGGRGTGVAREAAEHGNMVAVCDVDESHVGQARQIWPKAQGYKDFRKLLERRDVDIVVNGTPDHWHTLVNISAAKAGKDVYSEKPLTLTIDEGKKLVAAVKQTKRVLQTGSQQRSDKNFRLACELVRNGRLG